MESSGRKSQPGIFRKAFKKMALLIFFFDLVFILFYFLSNSAILPEDPQSLLLAIAGVISILLVFISLTGMIITVMSKGKFFGKLIGTFGYFFLFAFSLFVTFAENIINAISKGL